MDIGAMAVIILVAGCAIYFSLYFIAKKAAKDALKEFFDKNKDK